MIPFIAIGPAPDYPDETEVEDGVEYDFGNMTGTLVVTATASDTTEAY